MKGPHVYAKNKNSRIKNSENSRILSEIYDT